LQKAAHKKLIIIIIIKFTPGDDFTNILLSTFLCMKVLYAAFLLLQFGFVIFQHKNIGAKAGRKMLMKLTPGVNFINILRPHFSYRSLEQLFSP
jgi:hypothetical protein